uniref:Hydroxyproline-rich glycoprotein family protein n=1 Tax=Salix viminalis TaxID=40686 RepID=A0A6N2LRH2_SALVM
MASFKFFIVAFSFALVFSGNNVAVAARQLLQLPPLPSVPPLPTIPTLPTTQPSLPKPTLPPLPAIPTLPTTQPSLPKPTLPPLPSFPTMPKPPEGYLASIPEHAFTPYYPNHDSLHPIPLPTTWKLNLCF